MPLRFLFLFLLLSLPPASFLLGRGKGIVGDPCRFLYLAHGLLHPHEFTLRLTARCRHLFSRPLRSLGLGFEISGVVLRLEKSDVCFISTIFLFPTRFLGNLTGL